ncbi:2-keto-4-pentenoate hydratase/2-oxohepta-3-ene-1,7-dioic acid hydratase (catechol pathway) [Paenimyroides aquimaris]|uniref:2-keto-4-pentenoate hydratase/2-oxohepta-3-ene-1,7-dioic acid hydratase (Catechol pathway) n=1 Tax=Paenimyroides marinum TaxID=1159016 RepID=A0A1H6J3Y0_9FLAO|nr:fumarylacetoacetate hydrolase family protein [Paenimyroides aquimaris]SEH53649.1 2-keto-4-pentenoate hydratase/2-oxohepta-3-ene-1,7-dioic acid hydratase (catechol pathway) [Paenimyroides aquimaris]
MKIICVGRNYIDHINELSNQKPEEPVIFMKPDTSVLNNGFPFVIPEFSNDVHHELEVVVKINKVGKYIQPKFAHKYYSQIGLGIDFTARDLQVKLKQKGLPWEIAKSFDGATVLGTFVDKDQFDDLQNLSFQLEKNRTVVQSGNTQDMLWKIDELIAYASQFFTLKTGDVIFTGTPAGVTKVNPGDELEGFLEDQKLLSVKVL